MRRRLAVRTSSFREMWWKPFTETGTAVRQSGHGNKREATPSLERYLRFLSKSDRYMTVTQLYRNLYNATGASVSRITVTQRLHASGLYTRCPAVCTPFMANLKNDGLTSCRKHLS
ncbi:HTH_Tnp_Tc3_2 domain-containing protein [Trichonephila clavipes]|nr:HTH_Tnp_Tc3_2 domain-containing protein [Trichonephila clavipes]